MSEWYDPTNDLHTTSDVDIPEGATFQVIRAEWTTDADGKDVRLIREARILSANLLTAEQGTVEADDDA